MLKLYLSDLAPHIDPGEGKHKALWLMIPENVRNICAAMSEDIDPTLKPRSREEAALTLEDLGETAPPPPEPREKGEFDRTPLGALADWCQSHDEPWLEKACRFILRHPDIRVARYSYYSGCWRWKFVNSSLPERWKGDITESAYTFLGLLCELANEIRDRLKDLAD